MLIPVCRSRGCSQSNQPTLLEFILYSLPKLELKASAINNNELEITRLAGQPSSIKDFLPLIIYRMMVLLIPVWLL